MSEAAHTPTAGAPSDAAVASSDSSRLECVLRRRPSLISSAISEIFSSSSNGGSSSTPGSSAGTPPLHSHRPRAMSNPTMLDAAGNTMTHAVSAAAAAGASTAATAVISSSDAGSCLTVAAGGATTGLRGLGFGLNLNTADVADGVGGLSLGGVASGNGALSTPSASALASTRAARSVSMSLPAAPPATNALPLFEPSRSQHAPPSHGHSHSHSFSLPSPSSIRATLRATLRGQARDREQRTFDEMQREWGSVIARWHEFQLSATVGASAHGLSSREFQANQKKLGLLFASGVPGNMRASVWMLVIGNGLQLTPAIFKQLKHECAANRATYEAWRCKTNSNGHCRASSDLKTSGEHVAPPSPRSSTPLEPHLGLFPLIDQDMPRTFPELAFFHRDGPYQAPLRTVLECTALYRMQHSSCLASATSATGQTGYVQGMSFLASILLLALGDDAWLCFVALANLLENPSEQLSDLFAMDAQTTEHYLDLFTRQLQLSLPSLSAHFAREHLSPNMYLFKYVFSIYSQSLQLDTVFRVWDWFLWECFKNRGQLRTTAPSRGSGTPAVITLGSGFPFLFRVALGLLSMYSDSLRECSFEECLYFLQHLPGKAAVGAATEDVLDTELLFQHITSVQMDDKLWTHTRFEKTQPHLLPAKLTLPVAPTPQMPTAASAAATVIASSLPIGVVHSRPDYSGQGSPSPRF